jgi:hypothetical protein
MSKELKQYRLNGLEFIHDSRGKFVAAGGIAWLDDIKAGKVLRALKADGRGDHLLPLEPEPKQGSKPKGKESKAVKKLAAKSTKVDRVFSVDEVHERALGLHFSQRKSIASELSSVEIESTREADQIIKDSDVEKLTQALKAIEAGEG